MRCVCSVCACAARLPYHHGRGSVTPRWERNVGSRKYFTDGRRAVEALIAEGFYPIAVELADTATPIDDYHAVFPVALVFADEMCGVASSALDVCKDCVYIPMYGMGNSMSVVAAMAIAAHHFVAAYRRSAPAAIR